MSSPDATALDPYASAADDPAANMPGLLENPIPIGAAPPAPDLADAHGTPAQGRLPLSVLGAVGEQLAATASALLRGAAAVPTELERMERWGLQLQELVKVATRAPHLRREPVDVGLALLQTTTEWSAEASRRGVDLQCAASSVEVRTNPAALKHLLDLLLEHTLQQGQRVRLAIDAAPGTAIVRVTAHLESAPAPRDPARDTLAWHLLMLLARALALEPERRPVPGGEQVELPLPRA